MQNENYWKFTHDIGHNFGCAHDCGQENKCNDTVNYDYGYRDSNGDFLSNMPYYLTTGKCDKNPNPLLVASFCFSNPNFLYKGNSIGSTTTDNARVINDRLAWVAYFFPSLVFKMMDNATIRMQQPLIRVPFRLHSAC